MPPRHPYLDHESLIEHILVRHARLRHLAEEEAEDFASQVRLKLWENDGAVIRRFRGQSSIKTYLTTVVSHLFLDFRREKWGRWRPSAAARRMGKEALLLEQALYRDRMPFGEAVEALRRNHGVTLGVDQLAALSGRLPQRQPRPVVRGEDDLERHGAEAGSVDRVEVAEREGLARRVERALQEVLADLDDLDRFLVRSFTGGLQVSEVARMLGEEQKPLYRRRERLLVHLRERLEARGLTAGDVADILDWAQAEMDFGLGPVDSEEGS